MSAAAAPASPTPRASPATATRPASPSRPNGTHTAMSSIPISGRRIALWSFLPRRIVRVGILGGLLGRMVSFFDWVCWGVVFEGFFG